MIEADAGFSDDPRLLLEEVDQGDLSVTPNRVEIATCCRRAEDVDRMSGIEHVDEFLGVAIDDRALACIAQDDSEVVVDVSLVLGLARAIRDGHKEFVGRLHRLEAHLGRCRSRKLHELGHQRGLFGGELAGSPPTWHSRIGAFEDGRLEFSEWLLEHRFGGDVRPGGSLAERTVTPGTAVEVDEFGLLELVFAQSGRRCGRGDAG